MLLPDLPQKILIAIMQRVRLDPDGNKDLKNLRLVSKRLEGLANAIFFRHISLPLTPEALQIAIPILTKDHIARNIRKIEISTECMIPTQFLHEFDTCELKSKPGDSCEDRKGVKRPIFRLKNLHSLDFGAVYKEWATKFEPLWLQLATACRKKLDCLFIRSLLINYYYVNEQEDLDAPDLYERTEIVSRGFCEMIVRTFSTVNFLKLSKLWFDLQSIDFFSFDAFIQAKGSSAYRRLYLNLTCLTDFRIIHSVEPDDSGDKINNRAITRIIALAAQLINLRSLELDLTFKLEMGVVPIAYIYPRSALLSNLFLEWAMVKGSLSRALRNMKCLKRLVIEGVDLYINEDTWDQTINVCIGLCHLRELYLLDPEYVEYDERKLDVCTVPESDRGLLCITREKDLRAARDLENRMEREHMRGSIVIGEWEASTCPHFDEELDWESLSSSSSSSSSSENDFFDYEREEKAIRDENENIVAYFGRLSLSS